MWLRAFIFAFFLLFSSATNAQLAPGTYMMTAPLAPDSLDTEIVFVYVGSTPIDLKEFGPDIASFAEGIETFPQPSACLVIPGSPIDGVGDSLPGLLFLAPEDLPNGQTKIGIPASDSNIDYLIVRGDESGFSGRPDGLGDPKENPIVGHRIGPPDLKPCLDNAEILSAPPPSNEALQLHQTIESN